MGKLGLVVIVATTAIALLVGICSALAGYEYKNDVDVQNAGAEAIYARPVVPMNTQALMAGRYIQNDGQDVECTTSGAIASLAEHVTVTGYSGTGTSYWITDWVNIPGNTVITKSFWMGSTSATRNQVWVCSGSDTVSVSDHNSLDLVDNILLRANISLCRAPVAGSTPVAVISKPDAYELLLTGTPSFQFKIYEPGSPPAAHTVEVATSENCDATDEVQAWFNGENLTLQVGTVQSSVAYSGTINASSQNISLANFDGRIDDVEIRTE